MVVHVGPSDLVPKDLAEMGKPLTEVMFRFEELKNTMLRIALNAKFAISEMFLGFLGIPLH